MAATTALTGASSTYSTVTVNLEIDLATRGAIVATGLAALATGAEINAFKANVQEIAELADDAKSEIVERLAGVHQSINRSPWVPASYAEIVTKGLQANLRGIETIISKADRILEEYRRMPRIEDHVAA